MKTGFVRRMGALALLALGAGVALAEQGAHYAAAVKLTPLLKTTTTSSGKPLEYLKTDHPEEIGRASCRERV